MAQNLLDLPSELGITIIPKNRPGPAWLKTAAQIEVYDREFAG